MTRTTNHRVVLVAIALAGGLAAQTGVASAATVDRTPQPGGVWLTYDSGSNQDEDLTITPHADGVVFEDLGGGPVLTSNPDCVELTPSKVRCSDDDVNYVFVDAGNGVNRVVTTIEQETEIHGGNSQRNEFFGTAGPVWLRGGPGPDLLAGGPGADVIEGFGGIDEINGFGGDDTLQGGADSDTFHANSSADGADEIDGGDGSDVVRYTLRANAVHVSLDGQANDGQPASGFLPGEQDNVRHTETVYSGKGDDVLAGSQLVDYLFGGDGDDIISGHAGADIVVGQAGSDSLLGGEGDDGVIGGGGSQNVGDLGDDISGGAGNDTLAGRLGDDLLHADPGADDVSGGEGTDTVAYKGYTSPVTVDLDGVSYDDGIEGEGDSVGADVENLIGGTGNDRLAGNAAANLIRGGDGDDEIDGLAGPDALFGDAGGDTLRSQDGAVDSDDCGAGTDTAIADAGDVRIACELPAPANTSGEPAGTTGQPAGTTGQAAGSTAPTAGPAVRIRPGRVRLTRTGAARFRLTCPVAAVERCRGLLKLRRRAGGKLRTVGRRPFALAAGATGTVKVRVKPSARGSIGRRGVRMTAVAVARDAVSAEQRTRRKVRVLQAQRPAR
jgi:Ca2+-binding RTX toxin-like protein